MKTAWTWMLLPAMLCGCLNDKPELIEPTTPIEPTTTNATKTHAATSADASKATGPVLATVNGKVIPLSTLHDALVQDYGLPIAYQIIANEAVRQELTKRKLPTKVTQKQIDLETQRALMQMFQFPKPPSNSQMQALLSQFLTKQKYTRRQWDFTMTRNAMLRRLINKDLKISDEILKDAFDRTYGATRQVLHVQVPSRQTAEMIHRKAAAGENFAELAKKHSTNPTGNNGGRLYISMSKPPKDLPNHLLQAVMGLKKPGDLTHPILAGTNYQIFQLEKIIPPLNVKFEDKKSELEKTVRQQQISTQQQIQLRNIINNAKIQYVDPTVKKMYEKTKAKRMTP